MNLTINFKKIAQLRKKSMHSIGNLASGPTLTKRLERFFLASSFFVFLIAAVYTWCSSGGQIHKHAGDFGFYFKDSFKFWDSLGMTSQYSSELYHNLFPQGDYYGEWIANPVFNFFLIPITVFGSEFLFFLIGAIVGLFNIYLCAKVCKSLFKGSFRILYPNLLGAVAVLIYSTYPLFLHNSLCLTVTGVYCMFVLLSASASSRLVRLGSAIFAVFLRPNSIFIIVALAISFFLCRRYIAKPLRAELKLLLPVVFIAYVIAYLTYHRTYPGGGNIISYFIYPYGQHFGDHYEIYVNNLIASGLGLPPGSTVDAIDLSVEELCTLFKNWMFSFEAYNFLSNIYLQKLFNNLGYNPRILHDVAIHPSYWASATMNRLIFLFLLLPGFLISGLNSLRFVLCIPFVSQKVVISNLSFAAMTSFLYMLISSFSIGFARYQLPFSFIFVLVSLCYLFFGPSSLLSVSSTNDHSLS